MSRTTAYFVLAYGLVARGILELGGIGPNGAECYAALVGMLIVCWHGIVWDAIGPGQ